jgi:hypothetical protein
MQLQASRERDSRHQQIFHLLANGHADYAHYISLQLYPLQADSSQTEALATSAAVPTTSTAATPHSDSASSTDSGDIPQDADDTADVAAPEESPLSSRLEVKPTEPAAPAVNNSGSDGTVNNDDHNENEQVCTAHCIDTPLQVLHVQIVYEHCCCC